MSELQINIPLPCHEDWESMKPENGGKFCGACQNHVQDFTEMSNDEIIAYFEANKEKTVCGRFKSEQMDVNKSVLGPYKSTKIYWNFDFDPSTLRVNEQAFISGLPNMNVQITLVPDPAGAVNLAKTKVWKYIDLEIENSGTESKRVSILNPKESFSGINPPNGILIYCKQQPYLALLESIEKNPRKISGMTCNLPFTIGQIAGEMFVGRGGPNFQYDLNKESVMEINIPPNFKCKIHINFANHIE